MVRLSIIHLDFIGSKYNKYMKYYVKHKSATYTYTDFMKAKEFAIMVNSDVESKSGIEWHNHAKLIKIKKSK